MPDTERCEVCDRVVAGDDDWAHVDACHDSSCHYGDDLCWGDPNCSTHAVDFRDRCKRAEAVLAEAFGEELTPVVILAGRILRGEA